MAVHTVLPDDLREVDVIIVGGGSAGCIIASRVSDAFSQMSILLIEQGGSNDNIPSITHPAMLMSNIAPDCTHNTYYKSKASEDLAGRELVVPVGAVVGGGSSVNLMVYTRPQRSDFSSWPSHTWSADEALAYMNKVETYHGASDTNLHGSTGPMHVSGSEFRSQRLQNDFIAAVNAAGWSEISDMQTMSAANGVQRALQYVDLNGRRQDTAHQYLHPRIRGGRHPNLHLLLHSHVKRVVFNEKTAIGVEFQPSSEHGDGLQRDVESVKARKLVVISSGALSSPLILERSGIGDFTILQSVGVPIVAHVPDVGRHYQDHHMTLYCYHANLEPAETIDAVASGRVSLDDLIDRNDTILGWNSVDAYCKLRPTEVDVASFSPALKREWTDQYESRTDRPLMLVTLAAGFPGDPASVPADQYLCIAAFSGYPISRGEVHITTPGLDSKPSFDSGIFSDPDETDLQKHVWMYKKQREIVRHMKTCGGGIAGAHPVFPPASQAARPLDSQSQSEHPIQYDEADDSIIEDWIRNNVGTTWHSLGTCRMSTANGAGVVDSNLNVHGVRKLKVADLSVAPSNLGCNTNSVAMMIGEKAADIIISELQDDKPETEA